MCVCRSVRWLVGHQIVTMGEDVRREVMELMAMKDGVEAEIKAIISDLGPVGVNGPLVDAEGFPRADIDVHGVRILRNRLARLQNDHKAMMGDIEKGLHAYHSAQKQQK